MSDFITNTRLHSSLQQVNEGLDYILNNHMNWDQHNQIGLRHRENCENQWTDSIGSLYVNKVKIASESDFSIWNDDLPEHIKSMLTLLANVENISWGRIRFMRLMPKTGLSIHIDTEPRYHLVIKTNNNVIFGECFKNNNVRTTGYVIPSDGWWYKVDTTREHFVYNGGWEPRIHLVGCPIKRLD